MRTIAEKELIALRSDREKARKAALKKAIGGLPRERRKNFWAAYFNRFTQPVGERPSEARERT